MADVVTLRSGQRARGRLIAFVVGLILGLAVGGVFISKYINKNADKEKATTSQQNHNKTASSQTSVVASEPQPSTSTLLGQYSQMLVEAARENVDAPSDEGTAAKATLDRTTNDLLVALKIPPTSKLKDDFTAVNNALVQYAASARNSDNRNDITTAYNKLIADLQKEYKVTDSNEFAARASDLQNTVYEGVRAFVSNDYQTSYTKQLQAENSIHNLFALLQHK